MGQWTWRIQLALICLWVALDAAAQPTDRVPMAVELIAETTSVQPGRPFWVGLRLTPEPHWHTYWRNPGEAGIAPTLQWRLPAGSQADPPLWPYPVRFLFEGIVGYGYEAETLLPVRIQPPESWTGDGPLRIGVTVFWLVCKDVCIPGESRLSLELGVSAAPPVADPRHRAAFAATRDRLPKTPDWNAGFQVQEGYLYLRIQAGEPLFEAAREARFFPYQTGLLDEALPPESRFEPAGLDFRQRLGPGFEGPPQDLEGVLVVTGGSGETAYAVAALPAPAARPERFADAGGTPATGSILAAVLSALFGGLLLNLMPCVFPVLSLKAMHLVESADSSQLHRGLHGLAYTFGAMAFFALLASVLLLLRTGGESFGWGFQLQSPWFVAVLAYLLFLMGLSFSGVLEFGASLMGVGDRLTSHGGLAGSFFTGALAAVVASPCTAPFMGTAVAYAIGQPPALALLVFMALGFGMALPFLAVSFTPALARALPRPGPWMDVFKRLLAFPLYLTVVWLLWVLGRQTDVSALSAVLAGMVLLAFAAWVWKERHQARGPWRPWAAGLTLASILAAYGILHVTFLSVPPLSVDPHVARQRVDWEPYSDSRLAELRGAGKPVLLNMTADWCISCIANERVALSFPSVQQAFKDRQLALLKGDWTSRDPEITEVLHQFGREGVPLYVLYPPKPAGKPLVLPQFLTPSVVLRAFERLWDEDPDDGDAVRAFDPWTGKTYILRPKGGD